MDKKSQTQETYNTSAEGMAKKFNEGGARIKEIDFAFSHINKANPKVLELGCGNGRDAEEIIKRTNNYIGIDYSEKLLELAKKQAPKARFELADLDSYEFPKNLDIVFSFATLLHSDKTQMQAVLDKTYTALNKGGIFFLSLNYGEYKEETRTDSWGTRTFYLYTPELMSQLAAKYNILLKQRYKMPNGVEWFVIALQK